MRGTLAFLGSSLLATSLALWSGCQGGSPGGSGGSTTTTTTTTLADASYGDASSGSTCAGPMPDGICQPNLGEDCNCVDCAVTAWCIPGQCGGTMGCDHWLDSCTCPDCAEDSFCGDPTLGNCTDAGTCDPFTEGCHCPNCWSYMECQASVAACAGGKPDGICDRATENCNCVDCQGTPLCVPCQNTGTCIVNEPCYCADCNFTPPCQSPTNCVDDGICDAFTEGCHCPDCAGLPECAPWVGDGGSPEGGADLDAGLDGADAAG
jgi:hypothetical protein